MRELLELNVQLNLSNCPISYNTTDYQAISWQAGAFLEKSLDTISH
jgi:hypothetical protein